MYNSRMIISAGSVVVPHFGTPNSLEEHFEAREEGGFVAHHDIVAVAENPYRKKKTSEWHCKHLRFVRKDRKAEGAKGLRFAQPKSFPRLRAALSQEGRPTLHAWGGFGLALVYADELVVPDYSMSGSSGWIIRRSEIADLLKRVPLSDERRAHLNGEVARLERELEEIYSVEGLWKAVDDFAWDGGSVRGIYYNLPKRPWTRISVDGESWGLNTGTSYPDPDGELSAFVPGWNCQVSYRKIPNGGADHCLDDNGNIWSNFFNRLLHDPDACGIPRPRKFKKIVIECMDRMTVLKRFEITVEEIRGYLRCRDEVLHRQAELARLKRTLAV